MLLLVLTGDGGDLSYGLLMDAGNLLYGPRPSRARPELNDHLVNIGPCDIWLSPESVDILNRINFDQLGGAEVLGCYFYNPSSKGVFVTPRTCDISPENRGALWQFYLSARKQIAEECLITVSDGEISFWHHGMEFEEGEPPAGRLLVPPR